MKFTNWTSFDPYWSEAMTCRISGRPAPRITLAGEATSVPVFARAPHAEFIQPCTPGEVRAVLQECPAEFREGLEAVFLLAGSTKQARTPALFRYGTYSPGRIFLHAFPVSAMESRLESSLTPDARREYTRWGAEVSESSGSTSIRFGPESLRRFYLYDVLLHELGHHVDERVWSRPDSSAERYAEWFAAEQARRLLGD